MATPRVLSDRELNRALLARQLLLKRAALAPAAAIERLAGLQAQWAPAPYIGLWSRLAKFGIADLERALAARTVVKATLMRGTLHLVSAADYPALCIATTRTRAGRWAPAARRIADGERVHAETLRYAQRPRTRAELADFLTTQGISRELSGPMLWWLIATDGWLVHVPPSGTWAFRKSGDLIAADAWLRTARRPTIDAAVQLTLTRHLAAFGPATIEDVSSWSSIPTPTIRAALDAMSSKIRTFSDPRGRTLFDLKGAALPAGDTAAPVRYLPKWDSTLLAYAPPERVRILSEAHRRTVIAKNGDVAQTILVDGMVAGTWAIAAKPAVATISVSPFGRVSKADRLALAEEGERLARFIAPESKAQRVTIG
ncbi:MAG TPA: winged helix DNA-binding domain-containing protein [Candidatus Saccharimonadales bacterium]|nr:winged helix DNA-binding domain-containing protein [Candidatus Saccharimonadales bacterium]